MSKIRLKQGDCLEVLKTAPSDYADLVVTSPPYDDLRSYNNSLNWNLEIFKEVANELKRVLKPGGVIVWVVGDKTDKGSETGTSFKHALYFKEIGLNIHDTMIYRKLNPIPLSHNRYEQAFEYMFVFSKGPVKTFNRLTEPSKTAGEVRKKRGRAGAVYELRDAGAYKDKEYLPTKTEKARYNIWDYAVGGGEKVHPAPFPLQLALDHVVSWSNEGDIILDPFMGSGTTGIAAVQLNRKFVGIEIVPEYFEIAKKRIEETVNDTTEHTGTVKEG